jgi:hypothetical protein
MNMPQYLLESNRNVINDLDTGSSMAAGLDPSLAGHEAAISQDLPFGHPNPLRTDLIKSPQHIPI